MRSLLGGPPALYRKWTIIEPDSSARHEGTLALRATTETANHTGSRDVQDTAIALRALTEWFSDAGLAGFDPFDVYDHPVLRLLRRTEQTRFKKIWTKTNRFAQVHPVLVRRVLRQKPHVNPWTVGLLLASWVRLSLAEAQPWPSNPHDLVSWLEQNSVRGYAGTAWSYPFGHQSRIYFPAGTPWGIVTADCGESLLDFAEHTSDPRARSMAEGVATFLAEALPRQEMQRGHCVTYSPIDSFAIHNVNMGVGAYLARAAAVFDRAEWAQIAEECLIFTLSEQRPDGSFDYWADCQRTARQVDNYHTGFVLRALLQYSCLGYRDADRALEKGWSFYASAFLADDGLPLTFEGRGLPINIHGCAEAVLCGAMLANRFPNALPAARRTCTWTIENLQNPDGSFGYGVFDYGYQPVPYTRWNEAWMMRALSELVYVESK